MSYDENYALNIRRLVLELPKALIDLSKSYCERNARVGL